MINKRDFANKIIEILKDVDVIIHRSSYLSVKLKHYQGQKV